MVAKRYVTTSPLPTCSTAEPASTIRIARDVEAKGGQFGDTPMTRTPKEAEAGTLVLMVGGPPDVHARIRPVLEAFANTIVHAGPVGAVHQLKLINNFVAIAHAAVAAEAIAVATKTAVDMTALRDIVMAGSGASTMFGRLMNVPLKDDDTRLQFTIRNAQHLTDCDTQPNKD